MRADAHEAVNTVHFPACHAHGRRSLRISCTKSLNQESDSLIYTQTILYQLIDFRSGHFMSPGVG